MSSNHKRYAYCYGKSLSKSEWLTYHVTSTSCGNVSVS